ncbi:MAG: chorismate synthase [Devosia sp. 67-54]|uniref:chorismate synthase n=1 Tax=unclassified Devosia TaxID=196773 RepID=UPI0009613520|nr:MULTISPECIES: chorismate synthase [unclassified Devosia]MBN9305424.1 chorismate synthase [Devosia sp.]OJX19013.1 MAG: chorismate synthase [Devosia sp. 67-54]
MSFNTFGHMFRFTTWGESHGPAIGVVVDGCPPGIPISAELIQRDLERRKPGQSRFTTQRREEDLVNILSGVVEDERDGLVKTTGTPISMLIENTDQRSKDYSDIKDKFRPGHADFTYQQKYGIRDYKGSGRASARETAARVAAGAVARQVIPNVTIRGSLVQMGPHRIDYRNFDWAEVENNPFFCADAQAAAAWEPYLDGIRKDGNSVGAVIEVVAEGVPAGWGAPIYGKLSADLASAMMSINAVKGVEIGEGMAAAALTGTQNADEMRAGNAGPRFQSNHAGGILGGISNGDPIVVRFAVKPTSSILTPRQTVTVTNEDTEVLTKGRHDPCVGIRAVPIGEAMMACVLADHFLRHRGQTGREGGVGF